MFKIKLFFGIFIYVKEDVLLCLDFGIFFKLCSYELWRWCKEVGFGLLGVWGWFTCLDKIRVGYSNLFKNKVKGSF